MVRTIAKDHDQKRQKILKEAAKVFAREGISRSSMQQVASQCGISKANIYHYYNGKDALLFDILDTYLSNLANKLTSLELSNLSPEEQLERCIEAIILAYEGMDNEHKIQSEGLPLLPKQQQKILKDYQKKMVSYVAAIVEQIVTKDAKVTTQTSMKDDNSAIKIRDITMSIFGMLNWFYMWNTKGDVARRKEYASVVSELCIKGIS